MMEMLDHKVLLVDDDQNLLSGLRRSLRKEPYSILTAGSGTEALNVLRNTPVDVVVSDQDMGGGMCGTEFLKQVRQLYPETTRFILTGKATLEVALKAINEGQIARFFQKPCNPIDLSISIRQAVVERLLLHKVKELMRVENEHHKILEKLESTYPGISKIERDMHGAVVIEEPPKGYAEFLNQLHGELPEVKVIAEPNP